MNKIKYFSLAILVSLSATAFAASEEEEEIPDLKKADACFRIVDDGIRLSSELAVEQKPLKQKEDSLLAWKRRIEKETKAVDNEPGSRLNRLNADIQKYRKADAAFKADQASFDKKMAQHSENKAQNVKLSCSKTKFSEDAVEQICTISKKYPRSCAEALKNEK